MLRRFCLDWLILAYRDGRNNNNKNNNDKKKKPLQKAVVFPTSRDDEWHITDNNDNLPLFANTITNTLCCLMALLR